MQKEGESIVLFMGTYPPRECGIATFTKDLTESINKKLPKKLTTKVLAINKNGTNIYNYPKEVMFQISDNDIQDYIDTAHKLNSEEKIKLVCIQHEFGIFGGEYGDHLLAFLEILNKPVVITFHSVLPEPNERLKKVTKAIADKVDSIVVMTPKGIEILREFYEITTPICVIPHGIPSVDFESQDKEKEELGLKNKTIISSFGLISSGKGYENVIESLPEVIEKYPELLYLIIGETHPVVRRNEGEEYRNFLELKVKELNLENNVKFYNKYLTLQEIIKYLKATDIYMSSGQDPNQITSGTLSYALGCGRPVISTPFIHARDILTEDKGILVSYNEQKPFTKALLKLLENKQKRKQMEVNAYHSTRKMTWPNVAVSYKNLFGTFLELPEIQRLPEPNLSHLVNLTDNFGIIQFAHQKTPDIKSGYTLDDNARALIACCLHFERFKEFRSLQLVKTYLDYIKYVQKENGKLYNYVYEDKNVNYENWSEDAHGRALWSLGFLFKSKSIPRDLKKEAGDILIKSIKVIEKMKSPRAVAFSILGLTLYYNERKSEENLKTIKKLSDYLLELYSSNSNDKWQWFEKYLTYGNSKLAEALFYTFSITKEEKYLDIAIKSLNFLISKTFENGMFVPIGQNGWYHEGKERAYFDQQPIEAAYMVQTLIKAYKLTNDPKYKKYSLIAFNWFLGKNSLNQVLYDEITGGCYDGLGENTININQGAESTVSFLLARLSLYNN
ncbi:glycosyltransferase [Candidatus Woesearchaeota archaeon]|nr:glycosyltransferase [Candidatus Woesearchaeota archaeon]